MTQTATPSPVARGSCSRRSGVSRAKHLREDVAGAGSGGGRRFTAAPPRRRSRRAADADPPPCRCSERTAAGPCRTRQHAHRLGQPQRLVGVRRRRRRWPRSPSCSRSSTASGGGSSGRAAAPSQRRLHRIARPQRRRHGVEQDAVRLPLRQGLADHLGAEVGRGRRQPAVGVREAGRVQFAGRRSACRTAPAPPAIPAPRSAARPTATAGPARTGAVRRPPWRRPDPARS